MIEDGSHRKIPREERKCPVCPTEIENEIHFLIKCELYEDTRIPFFEEVSHQFQNFPKLDTKEKYNMPFSWYKRMYKLLKSYVVG